MSGAQDSRTAAQRDVKVVKHERVELGDSSLRVGTASKLSRGQRPSALSRRQYNPLHTLSRVGRGHADPMETPRRELVSHLYHAALERPATERSAFLNDACKGDLALQQELESLLRYDSAQHGFSNHRQPILWRMASRSRPVFSAAGSGLTRSLRFSVPAEWARSIAAAISNLAGTSRSAAPPCTVHGRPGATGPLRARSADTCRPQPSAYWRHLRARGKR